jgi:hypothetical protein
MVLLRELLELQMQVHKQSVNEKAQGNQDVGSFNRKRLKAR